MIDADEDKDPDPEGDDRDESPTERLDRNWNELLQEIRVIQTGVQLLTGFLLTLPFQQRFTTLGTGERAVYLATAASSIVATIFLQAPVVVHRFLFRQHRKAETVRLAHRLALVGMFMLGWAVIGVSCVIPAVLFNLAVGGLVALAVFLLIVGLWGVLPTRARLASRD
jgi:hypothetical protein